VKICVFGAGAIGGYVAAQLWHTGNDVCVVRVVLIWRPSGDMVLS
jgi:ketopantoate reductase